MNTAATTNELIDAVGAYASRHANRDGLATTPISGLRMMRVTAAGRDLHSIYRPLICFILQGAKQMTVGLETGIYGAGRSVIVAADMPVVGRVVEATTDKPYLAVAIELEPTVLREVAAQLGPALSSGVEHRTLFVQDTDAATLDCAKRLVAVLDRPDAAELLPPVIKRELCYWLLSGQHGAQLRALTAAESHVTRLATAMTLLRSEYRTQVPIERLALEVGMSPTTFHAHFKRLTSLTPGQYQKRLRLIEARRLMQDRGLPAGRAAFEVGYESVSQFTREYARMFDVTPKQDAIRARARSSGAPAGKADLWEVSSTRLSSWSENDSATAELRTLPLRVQRQASGEVHPSIAGQAVISTWLAKIGGGSS